jgi:hypothetical protein
MHTARSSIRRVLLDTGNNVKNRGNRNAVPAPPSRSNPPRRKCSAFDPCRISHAAPDIIIVENEIKDKRSDR